MSDLGIRGTVIAELRGPDGELKARSVTHNLITQVGDQVYAERGSGFNVALGGPYTIKLGTGSTAPSKTGAGAALSTYLPGSAATVGIFSSLVSGKRRITYSGVYVAGVATSAVPITEVVLVNDTLADATSPDTATVARALLTGIPSKAAADSLTINWYHDITGV